MHRFFIWSSAAFVFSGCAIDLGTGDDFGLYKGDDCSSEQEPWDACVAGLACSSVTGLCEDAGGSGTTLEGEVCTASVDCALGLACAADYTCREEGASGTAAEGDSCKESSDCQALLECVDDVCEGTQLAYWTGVECAEPPAEGDEDITAYFEIPGYKTDEDTSRAPSEFYRLPFPNDIRFVDGHLDLSGHPDPGVLVEELGDPVADYIDVVENDLDGFGIQSSVFFRLNYYPSNDSLSLNETIYLLNIDPESSGYGTTHAVGFRSSSAEKKYICSNWIAVLPPTGAPLSPGTTYAAILTSGITDGDGNPLQKDDDFALMLKDKAPSDEIAAAAWAAYEPLRDYLSDEKLDMPMIAADIAVAAVFTTADPMLNVRKMREAVLLEDSPTTEDVEVDDSDALFSLETGTVTVPVYQQGTRPFATIEDGGAVEYGDDGLPVSTMYSDTVAGSDEAQQYEPVKYALSIPQGDAPEGGWPVFIYAHGTGGSEMSFVEGDVASRMANIGAAVIGLEQVQHGDRRGLSEEDEDDDTYSPENMFYNFLNPRAARDNNLQAAADLFQTVRFIERRSEDNGSLNAEKIYFFGHSQGTQGSFIGAAYEPGVKGFVLSGAGGFLIESLLGKTEPVDVTRVIQLVLMDTDVTRYHPMLNIVQAVFDPVDPVSFAKAIFLDDLTEDGIDPRSIFMSSGVDDSYTPENTQQALARALGVRQSVTSGEPLDIAEVESLPHSMTYSRGGGITTVVVRYEPDEGEDGHFVMFDNEDAVLQTDYFIQTMLDPESEAPVLEEPDVLAEL